MIENCKVTNCYRLKVDKLQYFIRPFESFSHNFAQVKRIKLEFCWNWKQNPIENCLVSIENALFI